MGPHAAPFTTPGTRTRHHGTLHTRFTLWEELCQTGSPAKILVSGTFPHNNQWVHGRRCLLDSGVLCNASWIIWPISVVLGGLTMKDGARAVDGVCGGYRWSDGMPMVSKSWESTNDSFPPLLSQLYPTHFADLNRSFHPMFFVASA